MTKSIPDESLVALDQQLCFMLYSASRAMTRAYQPMLKDMGITYPQYLVLMVMWEWDREGVKDTTVNALGARLYLDSGTLTPLLKRMELQGLLSRQRSEKDERKVLLSLTSAGKKLKPRALSWVASSVSAGKFDLEEVASLRKNLRLLMDNLSN